MDSTDMAGMNEMGGSTMGGMMKPWLHFTRGDNLFFMAWVPLSTGAVIGACIGLFLLAIIDRWVAAMRAVAQAHWARKTNDLVSARFTTLSDESELSADQKRLSNTSESEVESLRAQPPQPRSSGAISHLRRTAPFILSHDLTRGALYACQAALGYALMLAVMTFHAGYIIAIILGLGAGEVLFGRFCANGVH